METHIAISWWNAYKNYVGHIILPKTEGDYKDISYWRNRVFCDVITYLTPVSIVALVPSVFMAFNVGLIKVGISDLIAFFSLIAIMTVRSFSLSTRKMMFFINFYILAVVLLYYHRSSPSGMLFLLTLTVIIAIIYSPKSAYYSVLLNTIICFALGIGICLGINVPAVKESGAGSWFAISSNLLLVGLVCSQCLNLLLNGLDTTMRAKNLSEANLKAIIENTDANIYSLDKDFRYITFNKTLKNNMRVMYNMEVKAGDKVFDFLEKDAPDQAHFWKSVYTEALTGQVVRFEKDFDSGHDHSTSAFSLNPIIEGDRIIGLSCFGADITDIKKARVKIQQLNEGLELKVAERTAELVAAYRELAIENEEKAKKAAELAIANIELAFENKEKAKRAQALALANEELKKTQEQLVAANRELEAFSYSVSHDLRAPLRAVESYAQMLEEDYTAVLDDNGKRLLGVIQKSGVRMGKLIDDLLTLSRLGKKEMRKSRINMTEFAQRLIDELTEITPHNATIIIHPLPFALADTGLMNHVLTNLLSNAIKYSAKSAKPQIEIAAREDEGEVEFSVTDNGVGFDMRYVNKLFGVFQRLHADSEFQGTGVGLAIVKRIIDRHGGRIWAESEIGKGATFHFTLPT
jgi:signal transduction histidine kinase